jgi:hypothetical protein
MGDDMALMAVAPAIVFKRSRRDVFIINSLILFLHTVSDVIIDVKQAVQKPLNFLRITPF